VAILKPHRALRGDDEGVFLVVEAVLVAVIILTAIVFFTGVQRPTRGGQEGSTNLGQVSADTLAILQNHVFTDPAGGSPLDLRGWVTRVMQGDSAVAADVDEFLVQVVPTGARYQVRINNGVQTLPLLPWAGTASPVGAQVAETPIFPLWTSYVSQAVTDAAAPNQPLLTAANPVLSRFTDSLDIQCIKPAFGGTGATGSLGPAGVTWKSLWQVQALTATGTRTVGSTSITSLSTTTGMEPGMHVQGTGIPVGATITAVPTATSLTLSATATASGTSTLTLFYNRVPAQAPYGTWAAYTNADCTTAPIVYADVVLPGLRSVADGVTTSGSATVSSATASFGSKDVGRLILASGVPAGSSIATVVSATQVTLTNPATATASGLAMTVTSNPNYPIYGVQLAVWYGA